MTVQSKNWRVTPGKEPEPLDDKGQPMKKPMSLLQLFLKDYGHIPSRHHRRTHEAQARQADRRETRRLRRKAKREVAV